MKYDVVIVGAGPAGLFASNELAGRGLNVLVIEKGKDVEQRTENEIMSGVGGAGTYSDGTVNLRPDIGGNLSEFTKGEEEAWSLVNKVSEILTKHGMPLPAEKDTEKEEELKRKAASIGSRFYPIIQSHIGSDKAPAVIASLKNELVEKGIEFSIETEVADLIVEGNSCVGVKISDGKTIESEKILVAPGRIGIDWVEHLTSRHPIDSTFAPIDIGVRVEVPSIVMDPVINVNRDPKFHLYPKRYDDFVRTFCTNHQGFVVKESYKGFIGVNGHSRKDIQTENTNFAFLVKTHLTEPIEDTTRYGRAIAQLATTIGGGKPILQRLDDLIAGRRSTDSRIARSPITPTLKDYTPGDISMALPQRTMVNIIEGLEMLDEIIPGVNSSTLLYAPEIKYYAKRLKVNDNLETTVKNLYVAGDGAGLSHDIVNAAATGLLAGRGIVQS